MDSISRDFALSLGAWRPSSNEPISNIIQRINSERGGFQNITEESLLQEIAEAEAASDDAAEGESSSSEDDDEEEEGPKELQAARDELFGQIEAAHQSAMYALDFVSLLLSRDMPNQAGLSLSPDLRQLAGMGSMGVDKLSAPRVTDAQRQDNKAISKGWKATNLNQTVDSILASATRLEKEIEHETKYWEQVLDVSEKGWAVCRLPQEKHTLGVRFGFSESSPAFRNRSLAALRRNADGTISLDQGLSNSEPHSLRVRIQADGIDTGSSTMPVLCPDDGPVESLIRQARNNIFSEELWHELNREGRTLGSLNVQSKGDTLICPMSPTKTIVLELVPLSDPLPPSSGPDSSIAESIFIALSLLLSYAHRQNHRKRTFPPPPIAPQKPKVNPYNLLRPLLTRLAHQSTITRLQSLLTPLCGVLKKASFKPTPTYTVTATPWTPPSYLSLAEQTMQLLVDRLESIVVLSITPTTKLQVIIRTALATVSSTFHLSLNPESELNKTCKPQPMLHSFDTLSDYIFFSAGCAISSSFCKVPSTDENIEGAWERTAQPNVIRRDGQGERFSKQLSISFTPFIPKPVFGELGTDHGKENGRMGIRMTCVWEWMYGELGEKGNFEPRSEEWFLQSGGQKGVKQGSTGGSNRERFYEWVVAGVGAGNKQKEVVEVVKSLSDVVGSAAELGAVVNL